MNEDWYKQRNKRTDSFEEINPDCYQTKVKIQVMGDPNYFRVQVMLEVLANILARWCPNISIVCADTKSLTNKGKYSQLSMLEKIENMLLTIDPNGNFKFNAPGNFKEDVTVFIGSPPKVCSTSYIAIDANGWVACCSTNDNADYKWVINDDENPLGPAFAACLGNAELFRWANKLSVERYIKWYDLYNMSVDEKFTENRLPPFPVINFGRLHVIGCGAIGSSFTYLLGLTNFIGEVLFVDADSQVELHNTSSSLLFTNKDCIDGKKKAEICQAYLQGTGFKTSAFNGDYKEFRYDHHIINRSADAILCFANDFDIWSTIQNLYPPVVFHATTSRSWGINIGRHIPLKDNCIMCTFQNLAKVVFVPKCAEVDMPIDLIEDKVSSDTKEPHASILPFLSPTAAIVALCELIKLYQGRVPNENSIQFNMATSHGDFLEDQQKAQNCVICKSQIPNLYHRLNVKLDF